MSPLLQTAQTGWTSSWRPLKRLGKGIPLVVRLSAPRSNHPLIATSWLSRPALRSSRQILKNDRKRKRPGCSFGSQGVVLFGTRTASKTDSRGTDCKPRGGTGPPVSSRTCPADEGSDQPTPASVPHNGFSRLRLTVSSSTPPCENPAALCRCYPANIAPPAANPCSSPFRHQAL